MCANDSLMTHWPPCCTLPRPPPAHSTPLVLPGVYLAPCEKIQISKVNSIGTVGTGSSTCTGAYTYEIFVFGVCLAVFSQALQVAARFA